MPTIDTTTTAIPDKDSFGKYVTSIKADANYRPMFMFGIGRFNHMGEVCWNFPLVNIRENFGSAAVFWDAAGLLQSSPLNNEPNIGMRVTDTVFTRLRNAFAPYWAEATGNAHKNVQVIKALESLYEQGNLKDIWMVGVMRDVRDEPDAIKALRTQSAMPAAASFIDVLNGAKPRIG